MAKSIFPNDDAQFKSIYLAIIDITKMDKDSMEFGKTLNQLCIYFGGLQRIIYTLDMLFTIYIHNYPLT